MTGTCMRLLLPGRPSAAASNAGGQRCADPAFDQNNCGGCGIACTGGRFCHNGVCRCNVQADCNGVCTTLSGDPDNCGACGNVCPDGNRYCGRPDPGATCQPCSTIGQTECNGRCVDTNYDQNNCGACNRSCGINQSCINGTCVTGV